MRLLTTGIFSLLLHLILILFLTLNLKPGITKGGPSVYRVTLRPFSPAGNEIPQGGSGPDLPEPPAPQATEKPRPEDSQKGKETAPIVKPDQKKAERKVDKPAKAEISLAPKKQKTPDAKKGEDLTKEKGSEKSLQEAIEEMQRKVAIDNIRKQVASRGESAAGSGGGTGSVIAAVEGPGSLAGGAQEGDLETVYSGMVETKTQKEWALPENFLKGEKGLETIIVVIIKRDGKVQKTWFEKRSGNALYDEMAMRTIKKAEPFPPMPKELSYDTIEIGIRFYPH